MKERCDGKGIHPKARPYISHEKGICIRKIIRIVSPAAQRLALMCNRIGMGALATSETTLLEHITVVMGCGDNSSWYVDTNGCGMLQANDAEPPPKNRFAQKALQYAAVFIISLMVLVWPTSCQKDPGSNPTPDPITTDTITPPTGDTITPPPSGDTIVPPTPVGDTATLGIIISYENQTLKYPTMDTLRKLVNDERYLAINLKWCVPPGRTSSWTPAGFMSSRDSLRVRFALSPKIFGSGLIRVNKNYGGQVFHAKIR